MAIAPGGTSVEGNGGTGTSAPSPEPVVETRISHVDGEAGVLVLAGRRVEELARAAGFEEVAWLLRHGRPPAPEELAGFRAELGARRVRMFAALKADGARPLPGPMDTLRAVLAGLEPSGDDEDALLLLAAVPVVAGWWWRMSRGLEAVAPGPDRSTAADYLHMTSGVEPAASDTALLERYLVSVSDHGMNASTFTARVIASTRSDLVSAVVGAVGALKGPLHGGAPGPVLDMLDAIGEPAKADAWLRAELDAGRRIMGMGHRVYRVRDPRARVFEEALDELAGDGRAGPRLRLARAVEAAAERLLAERHPGRDLRANVEFYTAVLLESVGLPRALFTPTFAVGRTAGWLAHVAEQRAQDRLIRPRSRYVGPEPG